MHLQLPHGIDGDHHLNGAGIQSHNEDVNTANIRPDGQVGSNYNQVTSYPTPFVEDDAKHNQLHAHCDSSLTVVDNWKRCIVQDQVSCCNDGFTCYRKSSTYGQCRKTGDAWFNDGSEAVTAHPNPPAPSADASCVLRAKNSCNPKDDSWEDWETKTLPEHEEDGCRDALKFWQIFMIDFDKKLNYNGPGRI